jgi:hypothetical protein
LENVNSFPRFLGAEAGRVRDKIVSYETAISEGDDDDDSPLYFIVTDNIPPLPTLHGVVVIIIIVIIGDNNDVDNSAVLHG